MSYILDALRRADAERQHGQVPGLNTPPGVPTRGHTPLQGMGRWWALGLAVLGVAAALAVAVWWWGGQRVGAGQADGLATAPAGLHAAALPSPLPSPSPSPSPMPPPPPAAAALPPLPVVVSALPAVAAVAPQPAPVAAPMAAPAPAADAAPRPVPLAALSPEQRRELPPLAVSGAVWSASAGSRFVMLNGQLVREGDTIAPGLVLERIDPKSAVLRWRDMRIGLPL